MWGYELPLSSDNPNIADKADSTFSGGGDDEGSAAANSVMPALVDGDRGLEGTGSSVVMSADSAVTYTSVHSEARSWSIPSEDPYERLPTVVSKQAHGDNPEYVPENHIPVYILEPEHPEDLVPAEDEARIPPLPPSFLALRIRPLSPRALELMETEAGMSREAWGRAMDASDLAHGGVISLRTTVHAQMSEITELQSADRRRQRAMSDLLETDRRRREEMRELRAADRTRQQQIIQTLTAVQTLQRETIPLQGLVTTLQGQVTALQGQVMTLQGQVTVLQGQQGPAGGPAQPELPEDTGSSS
ncbi:hypothetical protein Tco_1121585 [Tanacetum coccineum]|uniref:Uncharacterized protein n=1 Tax=Tanacetum coccineum TaxID=301880 RepID=A0ABQ5IZH5_9ASTR